MQESELRQMLLATGLDVSYLKTGKDPSPPFIVYFNDGNSAYGSDERNEIRKTSYVVELYSEGKDIANQEKIEKILDNKGISYTANESYIEAENMHLVAFYFDITRKVR